EDRTFWHHTGANDEFDGSGVDVAGVGLLHVGYPSLLPGLLVDGGRPLRVMLERARAAGVTTSLDLAVVDPGSPAGTHDWRSLLEGALAHCDVVSPSLEDLTSALQIKAGYSPGLVNELAEWMLAAGAAVVAISAGHHGVQVRTGSTERLQAGGAVLSGLASWAEREFLVPPRPVTPRTTNGAGDASTAGLLFGLARSAEPALAGALAAACSAAVMIGERPTPRNVVRLDPALAPLVVTDGSAG
ncbi:MAG TPA: PfkB family carbohydrate kinase, partial [Naasia sp.]